MTTPEHEELGLAASPADVLLLAAVQLHMNKAEAQLDGPPWTRAQVRESLELALAFLREAMDAGTPPEEAITALVAAVLVERVPYAEAAGWAYAAARALLGPRRVRLQVAGGRASWRVLPEGG